MASLIQGFEYDVFISYRQKDNRGERWVSEFVEALKKEAPKYFAADVKPGAGAPPPKPQGEKPQPGDRIGSIIESLNNAPEIQPEVQ